MAGYQPFVVDEFGGLNTLADPQEVGAQGAVDLLNVDLDKVGRVRTRGGYQSLASGGGTHARIARLPDLNVALFRNAAGALALDVYDGSTITNLTSWGAGNPLWTSDARIGTPTASYLFIASVGQQLRRYNPTGPAVTTSPGFPRYLAVTPFQDNRLAQARYSAAADSPTGADGSVHAVFFSDPGAPETYSANNFIHLRPGDGEEIHAMVAWRDLLFVFKASVMFVIYGVSVGSDGNPIFNVRGPIPLPSEIVDNTGINGAAASRACASERGVYVRLGTGIYRTTGGDFEEISKPIRPTLQSLLFTYATLSYANNRVYLTPLGSGSADPFYVYDEQLDTWLIYHHVVVGQATNVLDNNNNFFQGYGSALFESGIGFGATDAGTAIEARYQSGWYDLGTPHEKTVRQAWLWGTGTPTFTMFTDHGSADSNAAAVTLGASPAVTEGCHRISYRGQLFSHKLSSTSGAWAVNRLQHDIRETRSGLRAA